MNTTTTYPRPTCWCGEPADVRNEPTDASDAHLACWVHAKETGYTPLSGQPFQYLAIRHDAMHVASEQGVTVCGLEMEALALDIHGAPCLAALDPQGVSCDDCRPFALLLEARFDTMTSAGDDDRPGAQSDPNDLTAILRRLYTIEPTGHVDDEDEAHDALAAWVERTYGLDLGNEEWEPLFAPGWRIYGIELEVSGLRIRLELDPAERARLA